MFVQPGETIILPETPNVPGLRFRRFRGESDYPDIAVTDNASREVDGAESVSYTHLTLPTSDLV